ncbi:MAG: hypothetical protein ACYC5O_02045 [Anaerolineae bacterium]
MALPVTKEELHELVDKLPDGEVVAAARFLEYLSERRATRSAGEACPEAAGVGEEGEEREPFRYPTVEVPWEHVMGLIGLLPEVPAGDALADTEAVYDVD